MMGYIVVLRAIRDCSHCSLVSIPLSSAITESMYITLSWKVSNRRSHIKNKKRLLSPKGRIKSISAGRLLATFADRK